MAVMVIRHGVFKIPSILTTTNLLANSYATKAEKKKGIDRKLPPKVDSSAESIAAKGFLRPQRSYTPPSDVDTRLSSIFHAALGNDATTHATPLTDLRERFRVLTACAKEFDHSVPNSVLHSIETLDDVRAFYRTPICTTTPLDRMRQMDLPENLHVQFDYHRFDPESDTKFGGQTAYNRSSTLVTGLKYKGKYKGHTQNQEWPFNS